MRYLQNIDKIRLMDVTQYETILVDLDGTLVDTSRINYMAYKEAAAKYGYHIEYEYFRNYCNGRYYLDFLPQLTTNDTDKLNKMHQIKKDVYSQYINEALVNVGLVEILRRAREYANEGKGRCKTGLVTTASRRNTLDLLAQYDLIRLFDVLITQEDVKKKKPDPEGYLKAIEILGTDVGRTLIFEDSELGIEAARRAGAKCVRVIMNDG